MANLPEETLLLLTDDESGKPLVEESKVITALGAAAVIELVLQGSLRMTAKGDARYKAGRLVKTEVLPDDPLLRDLVEVVHDRKPVHALHRIGGASDWKGRAKALRESLFDRLVEQRVLTEREGKVLGLFTTRKHLPGTNDLESPVVSRIEDSLFHGADPDDRTAVLVSILNAVGALPRLFPDAKKKDMKARAKEISENAPLNGSFKDALAAVDAALFAAVTAGAVSSS
ncbi:GOLPH3/VPS74 family protein [Salininema proteolyticum]|uniref:GPP34 family phosphoprotein n=1 Tax=Salininema proteolyticum TaxID=1607685 RepID=A0ABV8U0G8_9ACTN